MCCPAWALDGFSEPPAAVVWSPSGQEVAYFSAESPPELRLAKLTAAKVGLIAESRGFGSDSPMPEYRGEANAGAVLRVARPADSGKLPPHRFSRHQSPRSACSRLE